MPRSIRHSVALFPLIAAAILVPLPCELLAAEPAEDSELAAVPTQDIRIGGDDQKRFFLIGPMKGAVAPSDGHKLLLVLSGGAGDADFLPFVKRIAINALPEGYIVAHLVAPKWSADQKTIWPTERLKVPKMKFTTEEFADSVIAEVRSRHTLDPNHCYSLSWSSGGPAAYAISLANPKITGTFVAMSVYKPQQLAPLSRAKGRSFYLYQSPMDRVCPFRFAEQAVRELKNEGAAVELKTYSGGHGWRGPVFPDIRAGMEWLEANHSNPPGQK